MKNGHYTFLLIALLVFMVPVAATAIDFPHNTTNGYGCAVCHKSHSTLGTSGYTNLCTSCHSPTDPKAGGKPFYQTDAASPMGTVQSRYSGGVIPSRIYQTSHNWTGSDVNPAVGSSKPTGLYVNNPYITGTILCVRCHSVHGSRESATNSAPFLRGLNDKDQLCVDCHKIRNTQSHTTGSHPINVNYTSMAKSNPDGFYPSPVNANPANPTSAMKLAPNGTVQCTSCHAVHYSDSRSSTVDGAAAYNQLSTSKGHLLRSDARGKTANDINICTNCHAGKRAHNGTGQNIQCNDCHSGHVEYDPYAVAGTDEADPNLYVLRRFMIISTAAGRETKIRTFFRYTGSDPNLPKAKEYWLPGAVPGVCQACHNDKETFKSGHYVDPSDKTKGIVESRKKCADCHDHKGNFGCAGCHGAPPKINAPGTNGYAVYSGIAYGVDETKTPHATHADGTLYTIACLQCHKGNTAHNTGNFQQVFIDKAGIIASTGGAVPAYTGGETRSCSTTYCHSNGQGTVYNTVYWKDTKDTIVKGANRCQSCHGDNKNIDTDATKLSNAHQRHAATSMANYDCQNCHALTLRATLGNNTSLIYPAAKHVDGVKDVKYGFPGNATLNAMAPVTYDAGLKTCGTVYCHSNGAGTFAKVSPKWDDPTTGTCRTCHGVIAPEGANTYGMINSGIHFAHLSSTFGPRLVNDTAPNACLRCHSSYSGERKHVDGNFVADQSAGSKCYKCHGGTQQGPLPTLAEHNLSCTKCHPIWGGYSAARIYNSDVDSVLAPKQVNYSTSGHGKSAAPYNKMDCTACHNRSSAHVSFPAVLGDNKRLIAVNYTAARRGGTNAVCGACHWPGQSAENKVRFTHVTSAGEARNGTPTMACTRCHNVHGTSNFGMLNDTITFKPLSTVAIIYHKQYTTVGTTKYYNYVQTEAPFRGICQVCHTNTIHFKRGVNEAVDGPSSGSNANFGGAFASHKNFDKSTNCLSCHPHNPPPDSPATFAFYPYGQCDVCHGYPPAQKSFVSVARTSTNYSSARFEDYTGGGGAHTVAGHVPPSAKPGQGWDLCNSCHNEQDHLTIPDYNQVKVSINANYRFSQDQTIQTKYTSNRLGGTDHKTGTCSNVSCHFQKTPAWGNPKLP